MTIKEAAAALGLKVRTIRKWVNLGYLPAQKMSDNSYYIPDSAVKRGAVVDRANKSREHSRRIKAGIELGLLARSGDRKSVV